MHMVQHSKQDQTFTNVTSMRPPPEVSKQLILFNKTCDTKHYTFFVTVSETGNPASVCSLAHMGHLVYIAWIKTKGKKSVLIWLTLWGPHVIFNVRHLSSQTAVFDLLKSSKRDTCFLHKQVTSSLEYISGCNYLKMKVFLFGGV